MEDKYGFIEQRCRISASQEETLNKIPFYEPVLGQTENKRRREKEEELTNSPVKKKMKELKNPDSGQSQGGAQVVEISTDESEEEEREKEKEKEKIIKGKKKVTFGLDFDEIRANEEEVIRRKFKTKLLLGMVNDLALRVEGEKVKSEGNEDVDVVKTLEVKGITFPRSRWYGCPPN